MLLVRHIMASSANHRRAVFSPHVTALNTLYAMAMLQQEVPCEQRASRPHMELGRGRVILRDVMRLFELWLCPEQEPDPRHPWHATKRLLSKATFCMITGKRMNTYYTGKHASRYNRTWRTFLQKTLTATLSAIDVEALQQRASTRERPLRILDAACGTGLLLEQFTHLFPHAELYGIDESQAMLAQAAQLLQDRPHVHLVQASLGGGETAGLPYALASFDLITCTNTWHYLKDPAATLKGLGRLLVSGGQVVIEDYVLRGFPFPWKAFEWVIKYYDPQHIRLYTLSEAQALCRDIGFQVVLAKPFKIDLFCQGWVLCTLSG